MRLDKNARDRALEEYAERVMKRIRAGKAGSYGRVEWMCVEQGFYEGWMAARRLVTKPKVKP